MPRLKYNIDGKGAVKAHADLSKAIQVVGNEADKTEKKLTKQERAARRIQESIDPQKKYNRQLHETAKLVSQNALSMTEGQKQAEKLRQRFENAGRSGRQAFGDQLSANLKSTLTGVFGITAAVGTLKNAFQQAEQAAQSAADTAFASLGAQGEIQQLTNDPVKLAQINQNAKGFVERGVFSHSQRSQAFDTVFTLDSSGFSQQEIRQLSQLGESGLVRPENLVEVGGQIRKAQNLLGIATFQEATDKLVATAAETQASLSQVSGAVPTFGSEAKALGLSPDEVLGGFVAIEKNSRNVEEAGTRFKNFLNLADKAELTINNDLTDTLTGIESRVASGEKLSTIVPNTRALAGVRALIENKGIIESVEQKTSLSDGLAVQRGGQLADIDPVFAAGQAKQRAEGRLAITRESLFAEKELLLDAVAADAIRSLEAENKFFGLGSAGFRTTIGVLDALGLERFAINQLAGDPNNSSVADPETQQRVNEFLERTAVATERMAEERESALDLAPVVQRAE